MQIQNIRCRVIHLFGRQCGRAPVGGLLLLFQLNAQQILAQVFQAMPLREGPRQARCDLGALDRLRHQAEGFMQDTQIKTCEMKNFGDFRVSQQLFQLGRRVIFTVEMHQMYVAVARR